VGKFATNTLVSASGPVNLLFNQNVPPTGTNAADFTLLSASTGGAGAPTLSTNTTPPLVRGARYYLGVQNSGTSNVTAARPGRLRHNALDQSRSRQWYDAAKQFAPILLLRRLIERHRGNVPTP